MQNPMQKFRQSAINFEKPGIVLKTTRVEEFIKAEFSKEFSVVEYKFDFMIFC